MSQQTSDELAQRVKREAAAHTEDDILGKNRHLKSHFPHIETSPARNRLECCFTNYLSNVSGLHVLDVGCGYGEQSLELLSNGAQVSGFDISTSYIDETTRRAQAAGFSANQFDFKVMDAHLLEYMDETFDLVVGRGILHHLDLPVSLGEIRRVLKKGGRAVFIEPLAANILLKVFRYLTPSARTADERPLSKYDLEKISNSGWKVESSYYGLITTPVAAITSLIPKCSNKNIILRWTDKIEQKLNCWCWLHPYNQYVLISLIKK